MHAATRTLGAMAATAAVVFVLDCDKLDGAAKPAPPATLDGGKDGGWKDWRRASWRKDAGLGSGSGSGPDVGSGSGSGSSSGVGAVTLVCPPVAPPPRSFSRSWPSMAAPSPSPPPPAALKGAGHAAVADLSPTPAVAPPVTPAAASAHPGAKNRCDPPYFYDGAGNRVFIEECL